MRKKEQELNLQVLLLLLNWVKNSSEKNMRGAPKFRAEIKKSKLHLKVIILIYVIFYTSDLHKEAVAKKPVLDDALSREKFKEKVRLMNQEHINNFNKIHTWVGEKETYLKTRESITSVSEARTQLSLFAAYEAENKHGNSLCSGWK